MGEEGADAKGTRRVREGYAKAWGKEEVPVMLGSRNGIIIIIRSGFRPPQSRNGQVTGTTIQAVLFLGLRSYCARWKNSSGSEIIARDERLFWRSFACALR